MSSNIGQTIFNSIWQLLLGFLQTILGGAANAFIGVFAAFAGGLDTMFEGWGYALGAYGIWGPLMTVVSLAIAGLVCYLVLEFMDAEKDISEDEAEA